MGEPRSPNMKGDPSPFYVKELFVDFCLQDKQEDYFSEAIGPKDNLEAMSMLDSGALKDLEPGASLYCGPDLLDALHREVSSAIQENWLRNRIASYLQDVPFRNQVGVRLDDELNAIGLGHLTGLKTGMKAKAETLAKYRVKRNKSRVERPDPPKTFMVTLKTLIGGFPHLSQKTSLYFNYGTSFEVFLLMLRDATQRAVIPPIDFSETSAARCESSMDRTPDSASQTSTSQLGRQQSSSGQESKQANERSYDPNNSSYDSSSPGDTQPHNHPRGIYDRGYTLADGPWLYRFKREPPRDEVTAYVEVKDDFSFRKMVDNFKETIRKDPKYEYAISVIHSMDSCALDKWEKKQRENKNLEALLFDEVSESGGH